MTSPRTKWMMAVAGVLAAAFVAAGCGSSGSKSGGGGGLAPASKQVLNYNIGSDIQESFDPAGASYLETVNVINQMFGGLYRVEGPHSELTPYLAESVPKISDGGLTYTVKLKKGLKWSDGEPLTAKDAVFGVLHSLDPATGAYYASVMLDIVGACEYNSSGPLGKGEKPGDDAKKCGGLKTDRKATSVGVSAPDDTTVVYHLKRPVPWFNYLLSLQTFYPMPQHVIEKYGKKWTDPGKLVTSGPFKLVSYKPRKSIVMAKNDNFFDAKNTKLQKVNFLMVGDPATANRLFLQKKLDTGYERTMFESAEIEKWRADKRYQFTDTTATSYIYFNTTNDVVKDPKVRQGIALAIDRKKLTEKVTRRGDPPLGTVIPNALPHFDTIKQGAQDFIDTSKADVTKAKELLKQGGWKDGTSLNAYYNSESSTAQPVMESIQADLQKVGVNLKLVPVPGDVLQSPGIGVSPVEPKVDMISLGWQADYLDAQNFYQLYTCANVAAGLNNSNYCDPAYDKLYEQALNTVDEDARAEIYKKLEGMLTGPNGAMPSIPLYQPRSDTLVQPYVKNYRVYGSDLVFLDKVALQDH